MSNEKKNAKRSARYVPLPLMTLGDLLAHGLEIHVWCPRCHKWGHPTIPAERLSRRFAGARFRCGCGAPGYPSFRSGPGTAPRLGETITDLSCPHCVPPWEMPDARFNQPPWSNTPLVDGQIYTCPGCRRPILMHTRKERPTAAPFAPWSHLSPGRPKP
jgi:hypothetical protein